jgi:hypothetical protein
MTGFRTIPIDPTICDQARRTLKSPQYGHPVHVETAAGYGPCRSCLKQFRVGEDERLLFTYDPFAGLDAYPSPARCSFTPSTARRSPARKNFLKS